MAVNYALTIESNKFILKIFFKKFERLIMLVAIESLSYFTPFQTKVNFYTLWNTNCLKKYMNHYTLP